MLKQIKNWIMRNKNKAVCPVCSCTKTKELKAPKNNAFSYADKSTDNKLLQCKNCRSMFWQPFFNCDYDTYGVGEFYFKYYYEHDAGLCFMTSLAYPFHKLLKQKNNILEIGSGVGFLLKFLKLCAGKNKQNIHGLEPALNGPMHNFSLCKENLCGYYPKDAIKKKYDLIFCSEVIEHVPNFRSFFKNIVNGLSKEGIAVLTTPNADAFFSESKYNKHSMAGRGQHLTIFSSKGISTLCKEHPFLNYHLFHSEGKTGGARHVLFISKSDILKKIEYLVPSEESVLFTLENWLRLYTDELKSNSKMLPAKGKEYLLLRLYAERIEIDVNKAKWKEANNDFEFFAIQFKKAYKLNWSIADLERLYSDLKKITWSEKNFANFCMQYPCFLTKVLYYQGMFLLNAPETNLAEAKNFLELAVKFGEIESHFVFFLANEEIWGLAKKHVKIAEERLNPKTSLFSQFINKVFIL